MYSSSSGGSLASLSSMEALYFLGARLLSSREDRSWRGSNRSCRNFQKFFGAEDGDESRITFYL